MESVFQPSSVGEVIPMAWESYAEVTNFASVQTGSNRFFITTNSVNPELDLGFGSGKSLNFGLNFMFGSEGFRFELKFRTKLSHHYQ